MAELAPNFRFTRAGRPTKYPWSEWADGQTRILRRGVDFDAQVESVICAAYVYARRNGMRAQCQHLRDEPNAFALRMRAVTDTETA